MRKDEVEFYYSDICELIQLETRGQIGKESNNMNYSQTINTNSEVVEIVSEDKPQNTYYRLKKYVTFDQIIRDRHRSFFQFVLLISSLAARRLV